MMDRRENIEAILKHEPHDHIGSGRDMARCGGDFETFENGPKTANGGPDGFGLVWASVSGIGGGTPAPRQCLIPDITEWRSIVSFPDITAYDWEGEARSQLANADRTKQWVEYGCWNGPFLRLVDMMGMVDGLVALHEEPEACFDFMSAVTDYRIKTLDYIVKYFRPDSICIYDDFAHERGLFISPEVYNALIAPHHKKWSDAVRSYGVIPAMHVCGKCEQVVPGFVDEGFECWEIAQPENDLVGLQEKVGDKLAFMGCFDFQAKWIAPGAIPTAEQLKSKVRETIDKYGPGGNLIVQAIISHPAVNPAAMAIMNDEIVSYGTGYYCR